MMNYKTERTWNTRKKMLAIAAVLLLGATACEKSGNDENEQYGQIQPKGPKPAWGPTITPQMQTVIEALDSLSSAPPYTFSPQQARQQPTPADAAMRVMSNYGIVMPPMNADTMGRHIPVNGGEIHVRIYTPKTGRTSYPMITYYHGGGWVLATVDTYHASALALSEKADAIVVSVEYRKGPEFKFPTAHNDAFAAYKWTLANASTLKGDSTRVAVVGESAGGNLAIAVSMMARDSAVRMPVHQLAVYPIANNDVNTASYLQYAEAKPLNKPFMEWFFMHYFRTPQDSNHPWISLVDVANLSNLPPSTIIGAEIDPLQSEGKELADKLQAANVATTYRLYNGVVHEFFGMALVVPEAKEAQDLAAERLRQAFNQ